MNRNVKNADRKTVCSRFCLKENGRIAEIYGVDAMFSRENYIWNRK